jgi:hypothetical protein
MKDFRWKIIVCLAVGAFAGSLLAAPQASQQAPKPVDISGVWEMTMQTPQGEMKADATFVQKDDVFKVTMPGPMGNEMNGEGKVKGNEVEWKFSLQGPEGGEFVLVFKGKVDGDKMTGDIQMGDFGTSPFTAVKKK